MSEAMKRLQDLGQDFDAQDTIQSLTAKLERAKEAIERLGSSEAMTTAFMRRDNREGLELDARLTYARQALKDINDE